MKRLLSYLFIVFGFGFIINISIYSITFANFNDLNKYNFCERTGTIQLSDCWKGSSSFDGFLVYYLTKRSKSESDVNRTAQEIFDRELLRLLEEFKVYNFDPNEILNGIKRNKKLKELLENSNTTFANLDNPTEKDIVYKTNQYKALICGVGQVWSSEQRFRAVYIRNFDSSCQYTRINPELYFKILDNPSKYYENWNNSKKYLKNPICLVKNTKKIHNISKKCDDKEIKLLVSGNDENFLFLKIDESEEKRIADAKKKKEEEEKRIADAKKKQEEEEKRIADAKKKKEEEEKNKKQKDDELFVIGSGSGFFVSSNGYAVSNDHVVGICRKVASKIKGKIIYFDIISTDQKNDLGLLKSDYRNTEFLNIKISGAEFGEDIVAFGFPLSDALSSSIKLTRGIVSALSGPENNFSEIQIDAAIQPGNSGGPVINMQGQVVGVASSGLNKLYMLEKTEYIPENVNFAVAAPTLTNFLRANGVSVSNRSLRVKNTKDLAKIGRPSTLQLFCMNTKAAYEKLKKQQKHSDVLLEKVVELK